MATNLQVAGAVGRAALDARLDGAPEWLARRRTEAWDTYSALPMPSSQHDEDWRRTDIRGLVPEDYVSEPGPSAHGDALVEAMRRLRDQALPGGAFVVNTRRGVRACEGLDELTAQGVVVGSLEDAATRHPEGAVVVVGCAPTALEEVLAMARAGRLAPALVIGLPVGFVGAAAAKAAARRSGLAVITNVGEKGGSAVAAAACNAIVRLARG